MPNPGSPLSLETWCMADLESWLCDNTTLLRGGAGGYISTSPKMTSTFHNNVHVSIPSPSSAGPAAAESPTLYDNTPGKGFVGPPAYIQVKQEIDDGAEYQCPGARINNNVTPTTMTIKREEPEGLTRESMEQLRKLAMEQAAKDIHVACDILGISAGKSVFKFILLIITFYSKMEKRFALLHKSGVERKNYLY